MATKNVPFDAAIEEAVFNDLIAGRAMHLGEVFRYAVSHGLLPFSNPDIAREFNDEFDGFAEFFKNASQQNCETVLTAADTPFDWLLNYRSQLVYNVSHSSNLWISNLEMAKSTDDIIELFLTNGTFPSHADLLFCAWVVSWINTVAGMDTSFISNALTADWYGLPPPSADVVAWAMDALATSGDHEHLHNVDHADLLSVDDWVGLLEPIKDKINPSRQAERIAALPLNQTGRELLLERFRP